MVTPAINMATYGEKNMADKVQLTRPLNEKNGKNIDYSFCTRFYSQFIRITVRWFVYYEINKQKNQHSQKWREPYCHVCDNRHAL